MAASDQGSDARAVFREFIEVPPDMESAAKAAYWAETASGLSS
jgi:hypothetical protein